MDAHRRADRARHPHALQALAGRRARRRVRRLRRAVALVGRATSRTSGPRSGTTSRCAPRRRYERVLGSREMPGADWFAGRRAQLRRARAARAATTTPSRSSTPPSCASSASSRWGELREQVARIAGGLRALGVSAGDRVVAYMPNIPETLVGVPGRAPRSARSGRACSPDFGARSVIDRFAQIEPKVLLAVDGYRYGGQGLRPPATSWPGCARRCRRSSTRSCCPTSTSRPRRRAPGRRHPLGGSSLERGDGGRAELRAACPSTTRCGCSTPRARPGCPRRSSRATAASCSSSSRRSHLHLDAKAGDRVFWFTTTGWMMWNFLVGVPAHRRGDRALRRQPRPPRPGRALGPGRATRA